MRGGIRHTYERKLSLSIKNQPKHERITHPFSLNIRCVFIYCWARVTLTLTNSKVTLAQQQPCCCAAVNNFVLAIQGKRIMKFTEFLVVNH